MLKKNLLIFILSLVTLFVQSEMINEIVVTGDWRETSLSDAGASLALITDDQIERKQLKHFEDVTYLVPNLNFAASDSRPRYFQIRGIGERSGYEGTPNSSVGFLIDDIDFSGQGGIASTYDIEQIEIYRGPQGSRMGANALAGMVYIKTKDPKDFFQLQGGLTFGDFGRKDIKALINIPFTENIQSRLTINKEDFDGFRKNLFFNSKDTSRKDETSIRFKTNWHISESSFLNLVYFSNDFDDPSDIWTIDGSLNTLSDRPGMDSQKSDALGLKFQVENSLSKFQILFSETDTNVIFSFDADWGNPQSHFPYVYDYFSETLRNRQTSSLEFRFLSKPQTAKAGNIEWVFGYSIFEIDEANTKNDDGASGDSSDSLDIFRSESTFTID
jgi:outer membrane receptor protein involved in Fe transport